MEIPEAPSFAVKGALHGGLWMAQRLSQGYNSSEQGDSVLTTLFFLHTYDVWTHFFGESVLCKLKRHPQQNQIICSCFEKNA